MSYKSSVVHLFILPSAPAMHLLNCINFKWHIHSKLQKYMHLLCAQSQSCLTLCNPLDCSPPGSSVHGIFQAGILEWVAIPFSRGSSQPRDRTRVSCIAGRFFTIWTTLTRILLSCLSQSAFYFCHSALFLRSIVLVGMHLIPCFSDCCTIHRSFTSSTFYSPTPPQMEHGCLWLHTLRDDTAVNILIHIL